jgi:hypothetical protein
MLLATNCMCSIAEFLKMDGALEKVVQHGFRDNSQVSSYILNNLFYGPFLEQDFIEFLQEYYKMSNQLSDFETFNKVLYHDCDNLASSLFYSKSIYALSWLHDKPKSSLLLTVDFE